MREALWLFAPDEHASEIDLYFAGGLPQFAEVLLAFDEQGEAIGLIELSIRPYAEGCDTDRVDYVDSDRNDSCIRLTWSCLYRNGSLYIWMLQNGIKTMCSVPTTRRSGVLGCNISSGDREYSC